MWLKKKNKKTICDMWKIYIVTCDHRLNINIYIGLQRKGKTYKNKHAIETLEHEPENNRIEILTLRCD
jgi:hypothetical protein